MLVEETINYNNLSLEELAKVIRDARKEKVRKVDAHRGKRRMGTLDEELDRVDRSRDARDEKASRY